MNKNSSSETSTLQPSRPTALVVDDNVLVSMVLGSLLEELGFEVMLSPSAASAVVEASGDRRFSVMFVDLGLPDRSGLELIYELKRLQVNVPVIIATGYGEAVVRDVSEGGTVPPCLIKPFTLAAVESVLKEVGIKLPSRS